MNKFVNKMKSKANKTLAMKKQRGMSLLEVIIVLGIIGTMAAAVVILAQRAFSSQDITDLVDNTNSVRVAAGNAFHDAGEYPTTVGDATKMSAADLTTKKGDAAAMVGTLVQLGQVSESEARNGISGDYFQMQGVKISGDATAAKGFTLEINGLDSGECRSVLTQVANQWDYVAVSTAKAGAISTAPTSLDEPVVATGETGILRSMNAEGAVNVTPNRIAEACNETSDNSVVLGSK